MVSISRSLEWSAVRSVMKRLSIRAMACACDQHRAGYSGLWTAYYLKKADPSLNVIVLEKEFAGFGASGRNGGCLTGGFAWNHQRYMATSSREAVR